MDSKERKEELEKVKEIIKENYKKFDCGLFFTRNIVGDYMTTLFENKYFTLDGCYDWSYYELFGTTEEEKEEVWKFYCSLED